MHVTEYICQSQVLRFSPNDSLDYDQVFQEVENCAWSV